MLLSYRRTVLEQFEGKLEPLGLMYFLHDCCSRQPYIEPDFTTLNRELSIEIIVHSGKESIKIDLILLHY